MPNIEPIYIAVLLVIVIGAVWYFQSKKEKKEVKAGQELTTKVRKGADAGAIPDAVSIEEEPVPILTRKDQDPQALLEESRADEAAAVSADSESNAAATAPESAEVEPALYEEPVAPPSALRRKAEVDPAVEAVVNITPLEGYFNLSSLKKLIEDTQAEPLLKGLVRVQCFDKVSGGWYDGADRVTECTQIYLSMLLANRSRCVDPPTASKFLIYAEQFAIELKGETETPDSNEMIEGAERIGRIIRAFDKRLSVKLVAAKDITEQELDQAAAGCGFVKTDGHYEKFVPGVHAPVFHIMPSQTLGNEVELSFSVPLMVPASDPLGQFFAIANDLCCRIDAVMTDASGNPIGARAASRIASVLKNMHSTMAEHGVPAGSRRACLIFSSDE